MPDVIKFFGEGLPYQTKLKSQREITGKLIVVEGTDGVGRSTQIELLTQWLKVRGFGVVTTGWTRSKLMRNAIEYAKSGNMLDRQTFSLLYATDFADRLENEILPALRSGFIVIADRYVYTAWARDSIRDPSMQWVRDLYGFAPVPNLTCYLRIDVDNLIPRVIESGGMDYWESGQDMHLADNIFDSFKKYQKIMIEAYDQLAEECSFEVLDARREVTELQNDLRSRIEKVIGEPTPFQQTPPIGGNTSNLLARYRTKPLSAAGESYPKRQKNAQANSGDYPLNWVLPSLETPEEMKEKLKPTPQENNTLKIKLEEEENASPTPWQPAFHISTKSG